MKSKALRKSISFIISFMMAFGSFAMIVLPAGAQSLSGGLIGQFFATDNRWEDTQGNGAGLGWGIGDFPSDKNADGFYYVNSFLKIDNTSIFQNVDDSTGLTLAYTYRPTQNSDHHHLFSFGARDAARDQINGDTIKNHFYVSATTSWFSNGIAPVIGYVDSSGNEHIKATPDGAPAFESGKTYDVVIRITNAAITYWINGVQYAAAYAETGGDEYLDDVLSEIGSYHYNYLGRSRWNTANKWGNGNNDSDADFAGYLKNVRIYGSAMSADEVMLDDAYDAYTRFYDAADLSANLTQTGEANQFNAVAYHTVNVASGAYGNLAYAPYDQTNFTGGSDTDGYKEVGAMLFKVITPRDIVMVYDGVHDVYSPIELETKKHDKTAVSNQRLKYVESNEASLPLSQYWYGYQDGGGDNYKLWAGSHTDNWFSHVSDGAWDVGQDNKNTPRFWWNKLQYAGFGDTVAYYEQFRNISFSACSPYENWGNHEPVDTLASESNYLILNYQPIYVALPSALACYNEIKANGWKYTDASLSHAKATIAQIVSANPNQSVYTYGTDATAAVQHCAINIKKSVALLGSADSSYSYGYEGLNLVKKTGDVVFQQEDGTVIVTISDMNYGDTVPAVDVPEIPSKAFDSSNHYVDPSWDTDFSCINQPITIVKATYTSVPHSMVTDAAVPANCTSTGLTEGSHCSGCNYRIAQTTVPIDSNAHDFSVYVETVAPTCVAGGYDIYKCSRCDATTQRNATSVDANAHDFSVLVETVAPTCVAGGYDIYKCSRCDATTQRNATSVDANAHDFSVFVDTVAPTCVAGGYDIYKCSRCDATTQKNNTSIDETNHATTETVLRNSVSSGYTSVGYSGDIYCVACDRLISSGTEIAKLDINSNSVYIAAKELQADALTNPDKYDADAVNALNAKITELDNALAVDDNEDAVLAAIGDLETIAQSMGTNILFALTVNSDNGSEAVVVKGTAGSSVDLGEPIKDGYLFKEWNVTAGSINGTVYTFTDTDASADAVYTVNTSAATAGVQSIIDHRDDYDDAYVTALSLQIDALNGIDASDPSNNDEVKAIVDAVNELLQQSDVNKAYYVTFTLDGNEVKKEKVKTGGSVSAPPQDELKPYDEVNHWRFSGWTGNYTNVTRNEIVSGVYSLEAHDWTEGAVIEPATCRAVGTQAQSCSCGAQGVMTLPVDPDAHHYGEMIREVSPTCLSEGTKAHCICSICGKFFDANHSVMDTIVLEKLDHMLQHVEAKAAGCPLHSARSAAPRRNAAPIAPSGNDGNVEFWYCESCGNYYEDADATALLNEDEIIIPASHQLTHTNGVPATHDATGTKEYWCCGICEYYFLTQAATNPLTQTELNEQLTIPVSDIHTPRSAVIENKTDATCTASGSYELVVYCVEGGEELSRTVKTIPAKGHTWGAWETVTPATEEEDGIARHVCSVCGAEETKRLSEIEEVTKTIKFVNIPKMYYLLDLGDGEVYIIYNSSMIEWISTQPLRFQAVTSNGFNYEDVIVYANGQEITPDADGFYSLPQTADAVVVTASGAVADDTAPNGKLSFWELLLRFFRRIISVFSGLFSKE